MHRTIIRLPEVQRRTGLSRSEIYRHVDDGSFPAPVPLGKRAIGWVDEEVDAYVEARIAAREPRGSVCTKN